MINKWVLTSPVIIGERETVTLSISFPEATETTIASDGLIVYKGTSDVTSSVTSGANSYSGNIITLKALTGLTKNTTYVCSMLVVIDGVSDEYKLQVYCAGSDHEQKGRWMLEDVLVQSPRAEIPYSVSFPGAEAVSVNATTALKVYKNGTDVTSSVTSGTNSASGVVVTTKTIKSLTQGTYVYSLVATVDGNTVEVKGKLLCPKSTAQQ